MRGLTSPEILELWENCSHLHPIDRVLSIMRQASDQSYEELAGLPIGRRNAALLALRKATFGNTLPAKTVCPHCGETKEFAFTCSALFTDSELLEYRDIDFADYRVTIRPLNSFDLALAQSCKTPEQARESLLNSSMKKIRFQQGDIEKEKLSDEVREYVAGKVSDLDPWAEIILNLDCDGCNHSWQELLDIGHIFWLEIKLRAKRLLTEIHLLAKAYGWTEREILTLSDQRRSTYLQMVTS